MVPSRCHVGMPIVVGSAVLLALLAGCLGAQPPSGPAPASGVVDLPGAPAEMLANAALVIAPATGHVGSREFTGSFQAGQACIGAGCLLSLVHDESVHIHLYDITDVVPLGITTEMNISLRVSSMPTGGESGFRVGVITPERVSLDVSPFSASVLRRVPGPVHLVVEYVEEQPGSTEVTYTVNATATLVDEVLASDIGVRVDPNGAPGLVVDPGAPDRGALLALWTAEGRYLGQFRVPGGPALLEFPPEDSGAAAEGYVLVLLEPRPRKLQLRAVADDAIPALTVVEPRLETGAPHAPDDGGEMAWGFDLQDVALLVGVRIDTGRFSILDGLAPWAADSERGHVVVAGPQGVVVDDSEDFTFNCATCYPPRWSLHLNRVPSHLLHPGAYSVRVTGFYGEETWGHVVAVVLPGLESPVGVPPASL